MIVALLTALVAVMVGALVWAVNAAAQRANMLPARRRTLVVAVVFVISSWLALAATLAATGLLSVWTARPPRVLMLPLAVFTTMVLVARTATFRQLLAGLPAWWPVALQTFRIVVELVLWRLFVRGDVPVQMTFEGRNFDLLIGVTAPLIAAGVAAKRIRPRVLLAWNVVGLAMLANVVGTAATSIPGPLHVAWPGPPLTAIGDFPLVWIPAFLAPCAVFLHIVSIRKLLSERRRQT